MDSAPGTATGGYTDRVKKAEKRIDVDPWDVEAWQILFKDAQARRIDQARDTYERLVRQFPTSVIFWKAYIQHEMRGGPKCAAQVERLFQRCLLKVLNIDLWKLYLAYVKDPKRYTQSQPAGATAPQSNSQATNKDRLIQAYEFALEKMSSDWNAYSLWNDYITFLRNVETQSQYADQQKILAIRKMYQHACATPMLAIESLWKDYSAFENETNVVIAKKLLDDKARDYLNARRVTREYETLTRGLNRAHLSLPPVRSSADSLYFEALPQPNQSSAMRSESEKQLAIWRRYIAWEKENPLHTDDYLAVVKRVMFAYEQCLLAFHLYAEVWLDAAVFLQQAARTVQQQRAGDPQTQATYSHLLNEVERFFERAYIHGPLRTAALLYLAHADFEEQRGNLEKVHSVFERYFYVTSTLTNKSNAIKKKEKDAGASKKDGTQAQPMEQEQDTAAPAAATNGDAPAAAAEREQSEAVSNVWCAYIRFCRRVDGLTGARNAFRRARLDTRCTSSLYLCAADLEYRVAKQPEVARRVFELGMRNFADDVHFVLAYLHMLIQLNRENDTRALFERLLGSTDVPVQKLAPVWDRYLEFEQTVGDHDTIRKVRERRLAALHGVAVQRAITLATGSSGAANEQAGAEKRKQAEREVQFAKLNVNDTPLWLAHYRATAGKHRFDELVEELVDDGDRRDAGRLQKNTPAWLSQAASAAGKAAADWSASSSAFARPNVAQLLPFKPRVDPAPLLRVVDGGEFQPPPAVELLLGRLPPAHEFRGPFVILDAFIQHVLSLKLPDLDDALTAINSVEEDAGISYSASLAGTNKAASRRPKSAADDLKVVAAKRSRWDEDDPPEEANGGAQASSATSGGFAGEQGSSNKPPLDLFRVRQLKRKK